MPETSKTADQALALLLSIGDEGGATAAALADRLGMHRTVAHRLLATLEQRGFVRRQAGAYELGLVLRRLGEHVEPELLQVARPVMGELSAATGESTMLSLREGNDAVTAALVVGTRHLVRVAMEPGFRHPLHSGAAGRALLASMDSRTRRRIILESPDPRLLETQLAEVRRLGYARSHDELQEGLCGIAAPVFGEDGLIASLSLVVPLSRAADLEPRAEDVVGAAKRIGAAVDA